MLLPSLNRQSLAYRHKFGRLVSWETYIGRPQNTSELRLLLGSPKSPEAIHARTGRHVASNSGSPLQIATRWHAISDARILMAIDM